MATPSKQESLANSIVSTFKSVMTKVSSAANHTNKRFELLTNSLNRWKLEYYPDPETPTVFTDHYNFSIVPNEYNVAFLTSDNWQGALANVPFATKPIYGMLLNVSSITSDVVTLTIPGLMGTKWPTRTFKQIDESLSYFYNSTTDNRITFSSMYHLGLQTVSMNNSVVLTFENGLDLTEWEVVLCIKCNLDD